MFSQDCGKCSGTGFLSYYSHIAAGKCFSCMGHGHKAVKTDPVILKARREKAAAKRKANVLPAEVRKAKLAALTYYETDSRIGPKTSAKCQEFPAVMFETCQNLQRIDSGTCPDWAVKNLLRNITR